MSVAMQHQTLAFRNLILINFICSDAVRLLKKIFFAVLIHMIFADLFYFPIHF